MSIVQGRRHDVCPYCLTADSEIVIIRLKIRHKEIEIPCALQQSYSPSSQS